MQINKNSIQEFFTSSPRCEEIVQIIYGLNTLEIQTFCNLMHYGNMDANELIDRLSTEDKIQDKTILNRALNNLLQKELCIREKYSEAPNPGYRFIYRAISLDDLKIKLMSMLESWYEHAKTEIEDIQTRFDEILIRQ